MLVLVGCEESQAVCTAFRAKGHEAYSCDTQDCSGGHPEWHLKMDIFEAIELKKWDIGIFFPPCTHLANAGGVHFEKKRKDGRQKAAILFFRNLLNCGISKIAIENPIGILSSDWYIPAHFPEVVVENFPLKHTQVIQPFYFADPIRKYTCLWLKNLPILKSTNIVEPAKPLKEMIRKGPYRTGSVRKLYWQDLLPKKDRSRIKSKTFPGIAAAMADQWGDIENVFL